MFDVKIVNRIENGVSEVDELSTLDVVLEALVAYRDGLIQDDSYEAFEKRLLLNQAIYDVQDKIADQ